MFLCARSQLFSCNNEINARYFWHLLILHHKMVMVTWFSARTINQNIALKLIII